MESREGFVGGHADSDGEYVGALKNSRQSRGEASPAKGDVRLSRRRARRIDPVRAWNCVANFRRRDLWGRHVALSRVPFTDGAYS